MKILRLIIALLVCLNNINAFAQKEKEASLEHIFKTPPQQARPWVFWYWMYAAVSKEGITADLEAMEKTGIGGAYLMPIFDTSSKAPYSSPARQLTPEWWAMVNHAMKESKRLGLQLAMHVSDGFALAGGPWIKPGQSMQKLVWSKTYIKSDKAGPIPLEQPETKENYYKDLAVFAYPANSENAFKETVLVPAVTASTGEKPAWLAFRGDDKKTFRSDTSCWIQYKYPQPFTLKSVTVHTGGNNYQSERLIVAAGDDGKNFKTIIRLEPPRHGWQDSDEDFTFSIPATTARYFRFIFDKSGTEPGSEDLDAAKWKPALKLKGLYLSDEPVINQIEAKNGSIWRVATNTTDEEIGTDGAVKFKDIIDLTGKMDKDGNLRWKSPAGNWVVVRIGHTATGHTNATGGAAKGLECDKFSKEAVKLQFDSWFGAAFKKTDPGLAKEVLKIFHVDSWEAGSQNWGKNFAAGFKKRRGYNLMPYLLVMTGVPVESAATSEKILHDVRETIAELVNDVFYKTLLQLAHEKGCQFSAESVAPTMVSDGLLHYQTVDIPMGEFWLNSPTHDKPNDMLDAISGGHIYGKNMIQAESFTTLKMDWSEHPGSIKAVGDRNFAMGINRMVIHVFTHNPWMDRKPGMTLGGIGLFYQRDQAWFRQSKAWTDYLASTSALLQQGKPVADIAVFTGEEAPRRAVLPDRLVHALPGIFGNDRVATEGIRLANKDQPQRTIPDGVTHSANMADPEKWTDALRGYQYDCFNPDALLKAKVVNGKVVFPSGATYAVLVFPGKLLMDPNSNLMSLPVAKKIAALADAGAAIIIDKADKQPLNFKENDNELQKAWRRITDHKSSRVLAIPYTEAGFEKLGVTRDVDATANKEPVAWTHRKLAQGELYFIANPLNFKRTVELSFRVSGYQPEIGNAVTGEITRADQWKLSGNRTYLQLELEASQSVFVIFREKTAAAAGLAKTTAAAHALATVSDWKVQFDPAYGGPKDEQDFNGLRLWNAHTDPAIKYYSGTAVYKSSFTLPSHNKEQPVFLTIDSVFNIASITVNGINCGTLWTLPYKLDISKAVRTGQNNIEITVSNTWANRLIGDQALPEKKRITWTTAPLNLQGWSLLKAGLEGAVQVVQ
ncbi:MAG: glycosyl hydrolase [Niabella sp.]